MSSAKVMSCRSSLLKRMVALIIKYIGTTHVTKAASMRNMFMQRRLRRNFSRFLLSVSLAEIALNRKTNSRALHA